jgi:hypothetical protein
MFIKYGERRINLWTVQEYRPQDENSYMLLIKYANGTSELLYFFKNKNERDVLINELDKICLQKLSSGIL